MLLSELFEKTNEDEELFEGAKIAWARVGNRVVRKYRCTSGRRQGRIVANPADCNKPLDLKKRQRMRITRKARGTIAAARRKRTMAKNPASVRVQKLNRAERIGATIKRN